MEEIYVLNDDLETIGLIDGYPSLIWANRYNDIGDCELYIQASKENLTLLQKGYYLIRTDDEMVCRIKKIDLQTDKEDGDYLIVTGYDAKDILSQRIIWNTTHLKGNIEDCIYQLIDENLIHPQNEDRRAINQSGREFFKLDEKVNFSEIISMQTSYKNLEEKVQELCQQYECGHKVILKDKDLYFSLYKGTDRSDKVVFSSDFENLLTSKYSDDATNLANVALIGGEGEGAKRSKSVSGIGVGIDRHEIFVDADDISKTITWEELIKMYPLTTNNGQGFITTENNKYVYKMNYIDILIVDSKQLEELKSKYNGEERTEVSNLYYRIYNVVIADLESSSPANSDNVELQDVIYSVYLLNRGYEKLADYGEVQSFEGEIEPTTTFEYKKDYFLGDIVTIKNDYGIEKKARIVEVIETKDKDGYSVEPNFEYMEVSNGTEI